MKKFSDKKIEFVRKHLEKIVNDLYFVGDKAHLPFAMHAEALNDKTISLEVRNVLKESLFLHLKEDIRNYLMWIGFFFETQKTIQVFPFIINIPNCNLNEFGNLFHDIVNQLLSNLLEENKTKRNCVKEENFINYGYWFSHLDNYVLDEMEEALIERFIEVGVYNKDKREIKINTNVILQQTLKSKKV